MSLEEINLFKLQKQTRDFKTEKKSKLLSRLFTELLAHPHAAESPDLTADPLRHELTEAQAHIQNLQNELAGLRLQLASHSFSEEQLTREKERANLQSRLHFELEARFELASNVAHRLNNPLNYIQNAGNSMEILHGKLQAEIEALFNQDDLSNEEQLFLKTLRSQFHELQECSQMIHIGITRCSESISELRILSGIDGYSVDPVALHSVMPQVLQRIRETRGLSAMSRLRWEPEAHGSLCIHSNLPLLKNGLCLFLDRLLSSKSERLHLSFRQEGAEFLVVVDGLNHLEGEQMFQLEMKLQALIPEHIHRISLVEEADSLYLRLSN